MAIKKSKNDTRDIFSFGGNNVFFKNGWLDDDNEPSVITRTNWRLFYKNGSYKYCKKPIKYEDEKIYKLPCDVCLIKACCNKSRYIIINCEVIGYTIIYNDNRLISNTTKNV